MVPTWIMIVVLWEMLHMSLINWFPFHKRSKQIYNMKKLVDETNEIYKVRKENKVVEPYDPYLLLLRRSLSALSVLLFFNKILETSDLRRKSFFKLRECLLLIMCKTRHTEEIRVAVADWMKINDRSPMWSLKQITTWKKFKLRQEIESGMKILAAKLLKRSIKSRLRLDTIEVHQPFLMIEKQLKGRLRTSLLANTRPWMNLFFSKKQLTEEERRLTRWYRINCFAFRVRTNSHVKFPNRKVFEVKPSMVFYLKRST